MRGRPKKNRDFQTKNIAEEPVPDVGMAIPMNEKEPEEDMSKSEKIKVVSYGDYLQEAAELCAAEGKGEGLDKFKKAHEILFEKNGGKNKFITTVLRGGETLFVFEE